MAGCPWAVVNRMTRPHPPTQCTFPHETHMCACEHDRSSTIFTTGPVGVVGLSLELFTMDKEAMGNLLNTLAVILAFVSLSGIAADLPTDVFSKSVSSFAHGYQVFLCIRCE
jgi:hypothetical protein